jgi:hypothetical protein
MSNPDLPPEILDDIIDLLHDQPKTLKRCCLVSKSWVPRTRKHLFADIGFQGQHHLFSWEDTFPDPSTSPACYAKTLSVGCSQLVATDAKAGSWIRGFSRIEHLEVCSQELVAGRVFSLVPFRGISPVVQSLRVVVPALPFLWIINLILSFPLLEDLTVVVFYGVPDDDDGPNNPLTAVQPAGPPAFTGSLELYSKGGMGPFTRRLLSLPGGIHFRKLVLTWFHEADPLTTTALVDRCSHTLESLKVSDFSGTSIRHLRPHR